MAGLPKILIIEDNPQLREIYTLMLESSGYTVETAPDGPHGLQQCMTGRPDIVFLDIMMPGMSGLEVLDALRDKPEYNGQNAKIVLLTNLGHDDRIEDAWKKKADGYVVKADINATDLIDVINSLISDGTTGQVGLVPAGTGEDVPLPPDSELPELGITGDTEAPASETTTSQPQDIDSSVSTDAPNKSADNQDKPAEQPADKDDDQSSYPESFPHHSADSAPETSIEAKPTDSLTAISGTPAEVSQDAEIGQTPQEPQHTSSEQSPPPARTPWHLQ